MAKHSGLVLESALFLLLTALLAPARAYASDSSTSCPDQHFEMDPKALYSEAGQPTPPAGSDAIVLCEEDKFEFDSEGRTAHTRYMVYKVLTQTGVEEWGEVGWQWEPWHEDRPSMKARVVTADFVSHELDFKTITDSPAQEEDQTYGDRRVIRAPLPAVGPGAVVEEEIINHESAPFFGAGTVERIYFGQGVFVQDRRLILQAPDSLPLRYGAQGLPGLSPQKTSEKGRVRLIWEQSSITAVDRADNFLPSDVPAYPSVTFSTGESWQRIAGEYGKVVDNHIALADVKDLSEKLTKDAETRDEKAANILQYISKEVRYTGIEFGDAAIIPHGTAETLSHRYGDCKDKAVLMVSLLRASGIPAYVSLLRIGERQDVVPDWPGMGMFDHAIVYVPGPTSLWIDTTDEYARLGELPAEDQGRFALVATAGTTELVRTPVSTSLQNRIVEQRKFWLTDYGPARVVEISLPEGSTESGYRHSYSNLDGKNVREGLVDYMKSQYLAEKLDRVDRSDPRDLSKAFQLDLESDKARRGDTDLDAAVVAIRFESLFNRLPDELTEKTNPDDSKSSDSSDKPKKARTADYQLSLAFVTEWQYTIVPPSGFQARPLPPDANIAIGPALLTEKFSKDPDETVHATIRFDTVKRDMTVGEATELRNKIFELKNGEPLLIYFEPAGKALLNAGKVREGIRAFNRTVASDPAQTANRLRLANALLEIGLGQGAREEAEGAVKMDPKSALAEKSLAAILEYDVVGRKLRPGSDYTAAAAAFRAAIKLDPPDHATVGNLALLLEYNKYGMRYIDGADMSAAISVYETLTTEQLNEIGLKDNLAFALFYGGQFQKALEAIAQLNPEPKALAVACTAAVQGSQAGIAEARKRTANDAEFQEVVRNAGDMLSRVRLYPVAADLMEAGASGDDAARVMGLATMLRKAEPFEQMKFGNDPSGAVLRFFYMSVEPDLSIEKLQPIISRNGMIVLRQLDSDQLKQTLTAGTNLRSSLARSGTSFDVVMDVIPQIAQLKPEGSDKDGYRVVMNLPGLKSTIVYLVKEDGAYKILDTSEKSDAIGLEILDRIKAGNLDGAKVLLDWIRDAQHIEGGDDPIAAPDFPHLWTKGESADAAAMKIAAAAILVQTPGTAAYGVPILEQAMTSITGPVKVSVELALVTGYENLFDFQKMYPLSEDIWKQYPDSTRAFLNVEESLRALKRSEEGDAIAQERLKKLPDDIDAQAALAINAEFRGEYAKAKEYEEKIDAMGRADGSTLNAIAWLSLYTGHVGDSDIQTAIRGTQLNPRSWPILHTLACLYAEVGRVKESRDIFRQAMDIAEMDQPNGEFWYGFGRIAEQVGMNDIAASYYQKVEKPRHEVQLPLSTYLLAQKRLAAMEKRGENGQAGSN